MTMSRARTEWPLAFTLERIVGELLDAALLEDQDALRARRGRESRQILSGMESGLVLEADTWTASERHIVHEARVKAQRDREIGFVLKFVGPLTTGFAIGCVEVSVDPLERTINVVLAHDRFHLRDGGKAGVPHRLRMGSTEGVLQLLQSTVGHHRQMSGGVPGVDLGASISFQHGDRSA